MVVDGAAREADSRSADDDRAPASMRRRFLDGLASQTGLSSEVFATPGVTVVGRDDRAGSAVAACYRVDRHLVVWADPGVVPSLPTEGALQHHATGATPDEVLLEHALRAAGFEPVAGGVMCTLTDRSAHRPELPAATAAAGPLAHRRLLADEPTHVAQIREFLDRSDPDELELAGLADFGDFGEFDEVAINVVVDTSRSSIVAYSSAMDWDWDPRFADIAVLVDPTHRGGGLASVVASAATDDILAMGRLPLYRYRADNVASARLAAALGFTPATTLSLYRRSAP